MPARLSCIRWLSKVRRQVRAFGSSPQRTQMCPSRARRRSRGMAQHRIDSLQLRLRLFENVPTGLRRGSSEGPAPRQTERAARGPGATATALRILFVLQWVPRGSPSCGVATDRVPLRTQAPAATTPPPLRPRRRGGCNNNRASSRQSRPPGASAPAAALVQGLARSPDPGASCGAGRAAAIACRCGLEGRPRPRRSAPGAHRPGQRRGQGGGARLGPCVQDPGDKQGHGQGAVCRGEGRRAGGWRAGWSGSGAGYLCEPPRSQGDGEAFRGMRHEACRQALSSTCHSECVSG